MGSSRISVFGEDGTLGLAFVRYGVGLIVEFEARLVMHHLYSLSCTLGDRYFPAQSTIVVELLMVGSAIEHRKRASLSVASPMMQWFASVVARELVVMQPMVGWEPMTGEGVKGLGGGRNAHVLPARRRQKVRC